MGCREEADARLRRIAEGLDLGEGEEEELGEEKDMKKRMRRQKRVLTMERIQHPSRWYQLRRRVLWYRFEGGLATPTRVEFDLIEDYLYKFYWEFADFDESSHPEWISIKDRLQSPNLRQDLIKFLYQVRRSKGYDVDLDFFSKDDPVKVDLYRVLFDNPSTEYVARDLKEEKVSNVATQAAKAAIGDLNYQMNKAETIRNNRGKVSFELLTVDKLVSAINHLKTVKTEYPEWLFLTLTASEKIISKTGTEMTSTVALQVLAVVMLNQPSPKTFRLYEWKFDSRSWTERHRHLPKWE